MTPMLHRLARFSTGSWLGVAIAIALASAVINLGRKSAFHHGAHRLASILEMLGVSLFLLAYAGLWMLLVVGPFRPADHFSLRGGRGIRVRNFVIAAAALVLLHLWLAFTAATARS